MLAAVFVKTDSLEQASKYLDVAKSILEKVSPLAIHRWCELD